MTMPRSAKIVLAAVVSATLVIVVMPKRAPAPAPTEPPHGKVDTIGFAVVDDRAVIDTRTGLYWSAEAVATDLYWHDACGSGRGGTSWRIPTEQEMASVVTRHPSARPKGQNAIFWIADKRLMDTSLRVSSWPKFTVEFPTAYSLCVASTYQPSRR